MNIIAFDIASEVSTVAVMKPSGKLVFEGKVETSGRALREIVRKVARPRQVVFEECTQANWLWSILEPLSDDIIVADPRKLRRTDEQKNDVKDVQLLADRARTKDLHRVWHGGQELQELQSAVRLYQILTKESTRLKNQIHSIFRSRGLIGSRAIVKELPNNILRQAIKRLTTVLEVVTVERAQALKDMIKLGRKNKLYSLLRTVDGIGPIFSAVLISEIGDPHRFRTRRQLWAYAGLAVRSFDTSEYEICNGKITRKSRKQRTRGLVKAFNRPLKCVFKQAAKTVSRKTAWCPYYERLMTRCSNNADNAQLTLARKIAAIVLHVAKTGERYDVKKAFKMQ